MMRLVRAAGLPTAAPSRPSMSSDAFANLGNESPLGAGHVWLLLALNASAAAMRPSAWSPMGCEKSSATEQPATAAPTFAVWLAGEKPSLYALKPAAFLP